MAYSFKTKTNSSTLHHKGFMSQMMNMSTFNPNPRIKVQA